MTVIPSQRQHRRENHVVSFWFMSSGVYLNSIQLKSKLHVRCQYDSISQLFSHRFGCNEAVTEETDTAIAASLCI